MTQPFSCDAKTPALRRVDQDKGEFWVSNPWLFSESGRNLSAYERNGFFLNAGDGSFYNLSFLSGADNKGDSRTVASWDITGDGMPELFVRQVGGGSLVVYKNQFSSTNWLNVSLRGTSSNRFGIGAKLICETAEKRICRELYPIVNFLSQAPAMVHFGLGAEKEVQQLTIRWPSGHVQKLRDLPVNQHLLIQEGHVEPTKIIPGSAAMAVKSHHD